MASFMFGPPDDDGTEPAGRRLGKTQTEADLGESTQTTSDGAKKRPRLEELEMDEKEEESLTVKFGTGKDAISKKNDEDDDLKLFTSNCEVLKVIFMEALNSVEEAKENWKREITNVYEQLETERQVRLRLAEDMFKSEDGADQYTMYLENNIHQLEEEWEELELSNDHLRECEYKYKGENFQLAIALNATKLRASSQEADISSLSDSITGYKQKMSSIKEELNKSKKTAEEFKDKSEVLENLMAHLKKEIATSKKEDEKKLMILEKKLADMKLSKDSLEKENSRSKEGMKDDEAENASGSSKADRT